MTTSMVEFGIAHGRFQPPHLEHLEYLISSKKRCENLVVAITNPILDSVVSTSLSPHRHTENANPFSYFDRQLMLRECLLDVGISAREIIFAPFDIFSPSLWRNYLPSPEKSEFFVRIFSEWEESKMRLFQRYGYRVNQIDHGKEKSMTASQVRDAIRTGGDWRSLVPRATANFIEHRLLGKTKNAL